MTHCCTDDAILLAIDALSERAMRTTDKQLIDDCLAAMNTLEAIRKQTGIAHFGENTDELTALIDTVVFG